MASLMCLSKECFNSLYGHVHFPVYAETISYTPGQFYDVAASESQSVKMLSAAAKEEGVWLIGGTSSTTICIHSLVYIRLSQALFPNARPAPESSSTRLPSTRPKVPFLDIMHTERALTTSEGELVAIHRKVHLFDIDIPGKIKFKVAMA